MKFRITFKENGERKTEIMELKYDATEVMTEALENCRNIEVLHIEPISLLIADAYQIDVELVRLDREFITPLQVSQTKLIAIMSEEEKELYNDKTLVSRTIRNESE